MSGGRSDGLEFGLPGNKVAVHEEAIALDRLAAVFASMGVIRVGHAKERFLFERSVGDGNQRGVIL